MAQSDKLDRLLNQLNQSPTAKGDQPLWQVIKQLIQRLKELEAIIGTTGGTTTIQNITEITQNLIIEEADGDGGGMGPPGIRGIDGATGSAGATGPAFPAFIYLEPEEAEIPQPIPGPTGATGAAGNTGATGSQAIGFVLEADLPEDPMMIPGRDGVAGNSASADWALITSRVCTVNANEDFIGLAGYNEILVIVDGITRSVTGLTSLRVSIDNGANFLSAAGDYVDVSVAGVEANAALMAFHTTNATVARSGRIHIVLFDTASVVKNAMSWDGNNFFIPTANALNAIRVYSGAAGGNLTGGTIFVYGR